MWSKGHNINVWQKGTGEVDVRKLTIVQLGCVLLLALKYVASCHDAIALAVRLPGLLQFQWFKVSGSTDLYKCSVPAVP